MKKLLFFLYLSILFSNCKIDNPKEERIKFALFSYLEEGKNLQQIIIKPVNYLNSTDSNLLPSFQIEIESDSCQVKFNSHPESIGVYINSQAYDWLKPLLEYRLKAISEEDDTLIGTTTVPGQFFIFNHPETLHLQDTTQAKFYWGKSETATSYMLNFVSLVEDTKKVYLFTIDTTINLFFYKNYFEKEGSYLLKLYALDKNIYQWEMNQIPSIIGGEGVFGSFTQESTYFYFLK